MYTAIKNGRIAAFNETADELNENCEIIGLTDYTVSRTDEEIVIGYDGGYYTKSALPSVPPGIARETARKNRRQDFSAFADPLKFDYDEAVATNSSDADEKKMLWLNKKAEIRLKYPY